MSYDLFGQFQKYLPCLNACLEMIVLVSSFKKENALEEIFDSSGPDGGGARS